MAAGLNNKISPSHGEKERQNMLSIQQSLCVLENSAIQQYENPPLKI